VSEGRVTASAMAEWRAAESVGEGDGEATTDADMAGNLGLLRWCDKRCDFRPCVIKNHT
jgi:hypothetical protein